VPSRLGRARLGDSGRFERLGQALERPPRGGGVAARELDVAERPADSRRIRVIVAQLRQAEAVRSE
jgi:hypothetical protein